MRAFFTILYLLLLVGCEKDGDFVDGAVAGGDGNEITLNVVSSSMGDATTRGLLTESVFDMENIGLYCARHGDGEWSAETTYDRIENACYTHKYTTTGMGPVEGSSVWSADKTYTWGFGSILDKDSFKFSFRGYSPYSTEGNDIEPRIDGNGIEPRVEDGELVIDFESKTECKGQVDLMIGALTNIVYPEGGMVQLGLEHALTALDFKTYVEGEELKSITIKGLKTKGSVRCGEDGVQWAVDEDNTSDYTITFDEIKDEHRLLLIPQEIPAEGFEVVAEVTNGTTFTRTIMPSQAVKSFDAGMIYSFMMGIEVEEASNSFIVNLTRIAGGELLEEQNEDLAFVDKTGAVHFPVQLTKIDRFWGDPIYCGDADSPNTLNKIGDNWEAVMIWHDNNGTMSDGSGTPIEEQITFDYHYNTADPTAQYFDVVFPAGTSGDNNDFNMVIAVRRKDGNKEILWSWHFWITKYDPFVRGSRNQDIWYLNNGGQLHHYTDDEFKAGGVYANKWVMDRNLGSIGGSDASAEAHGAVENNGVWEYTGRGSLYYQYGRSVPFSPQAAKYVNGYGDGNGKMRVVAGPVTCAEAVQNPDVFYQQTDGENRNWCSDFRKEYPRCLWNDYKLDYDDYFMGKSIFDPSPYNFCVPMTEIWDDFVDVPIANSDTYVTLESSFFMPGSYKKMVKLEWGNLDYTTSVAANDLCKAVGDRVYLGNKYNSNGESEGWSNLQAFYPAAGYIDTDGVLKFNATRNTQGAYWGISPRDEYNAGLFRFTMNEIQDWRRSNLPRAMGCVIRPISKMDIM